MTEDVNAAIRGAFAAGADEVIVSDGHWNATNILIEQLDPRARLNSGTPRPYSMIEGIDTGVDGVLFIGYHARVGHDERDPRSHLVEFAGRGSVADAAGGERMAIGEIGLNGAVCGHFGAPVLMISGDQTACAEAAALFPGIVTAVVKQAKGRNAAECLTPSETAELIEQCAAKGRRSPARGTSARSRSILQAPVTVTVEFVKSEMADAAAVMPGARRAGGQAGRVRRGDMPEAYRAFRSLVSLA